MPLKSFPVAWVTSGRNLLIVGGGPETLVRVKHAIAFDWARISVLVPKIGAALAELAKVDARVAVEARPATEEDIKAANLVLEDSGSHPTAEQVDRWCAAHRVPLNATDRPEFCDIYYMSLIFRDPLVLAITSGSDAPAITASLRRHLDEVVGPGWGWAAQILAEVRQRLPSGQARIDLLRKIAGDPRFLDLVNRNDQAGLRYFVENELRSLRT